MMKKSLVAIGIMAIVGSAWTAASWYTGKLIEQHIEQVVAESNLLLKKNIPEAGIKLSYQDYQRGLFSSKFRYVFQIDTNSSNANNADEKWLGKDDKIIFIETIDHGPFPLAQLKQFNFIPSMALVHSELENSPVIKELFEITKGQSPLNAVSRFSYRGDISSTLNIIPIESQQNTATLRFSGATINADVSQDLRNLVLNAKSDSLVFTSKDQHNQLEQYSLQGLALKITHHPGKFDIGMGDQQFTIKQIAFDTDGKNITTLDGFSLNTSLGESDKNLNGKLSYSLDALKIKGHDFGSGQLVLSLDRLDGEATKKFVEAYNQEALQALQQGEDFEAQQLSEILFAQLPTLLKGNPILNISPLSWKNSKGESTLNINVELMDTDLATANTPSSTAFLAHSIKKVDATLTIPLAMATDLTMQTALLEGYSPEESQKLAEQQVQGLAAMGKMFKLTTNTDDAISSRFHYADNKIDLNDRKLSLQEFMALFGLSSEPEENEEAVDYPPEPTESTPATPQTP